MQLSQSYRQEHNPIARSASGSADHHHERWSVRMRIVNTAMILTVTFGVGWAMSGCGAGDNTQAFCKIAATSTRAPDMASFFVWGQGWSLTSYRSMRSVPG